MSASERITIRLPAEKVRALESLVDKGIYDNVSDAIRKAIDDMLSEINQPEHVRKVTVGLPKVKVIELESLIREGDSISLDDAIRNAVREYTRTRLRLPVQETE